MNHPADTARLMINDKVVGRVRARSFTDAWGFGEFEPDAAFSEFAPLFGNWSLLMHADADESRLTPAASEELRRAEVALDALRCRLIFEQQNEALELRHLNIDGQQIAWNAGRRRSLAPKERR